MANLYDIWGAGGGPRRSPTAPTFQPSPPPPPSAAPDPNVFANRPVGDPSPGTVPPWMSEGTPRPQAQTWPSAWDQSSFYSNFGSPQTTADLLGLEPQLNAAGIQILTNAAGEKTDKIRLPNGQVIDLFFDVGGPRHAVQWLVEGSGGGDGSGGGSGGQSDPLLASLIAQLNADRTAQTQARARQDAERDELVGLLRGRSQQTLDIDASTDPRIQQQVAPYRAEQDRASRDFLANLAESAGPLANLQGQQRIASERSGQATANFQGQVIGQELSARRQEIAGALQQWGGLLTADQQNSLQRDLANIDAQLGIIGQQSALTQAGWQRDLGYAGLDRQWSELALARELGLLEAARRQAELGLSF